MARRRKPKISNKAGMLVISFVVIAMMAVISYGTVGLKEKDRLYAARESALMTQVEAEKRRSEELEEERIYVQTKQYIEDLARERFGLVYPNEIILKPNSN